METIGGSFVPNATRTCGYIRSDSINNFTSFKNIGNEMKFGCGLPDKNTPITLRIAPQSPFSSDLATSDFYVFAKKFLQD